MDFEVQSISKKLGSFTLDPISFSCQRGSVIGIAGRNGAGKTTLLRSICGLYQPNGGELYINGESLHKDSRELKKRICFMPESCPFPRNLPVKSIAKHLEIFFQEESSHEFLNYLHIFEVPIDKKVKELSTGNQKKLGTAFALATRADIVILDEPTSNVDPVSRNLITKQVLEIKKQRDMIVLFSSHILSDIYEVSDRVLLIHKGQKVDYSSIKDYENLSDFEKNMITYMED